MQDIIITSVIILSGFSLLLFLGFRKLRGEIYTVVDSIGDIFSEILTQPTVSKAFGIIGSASGKARGESAMAEKLATDILSGPKFGALKMGASALGIDIDEYIEREGAMNTITGLQSIAGALGLDVNQIIAGGLSESAQPSEGKNPYL